MRVLFVSKPICKPLHDGSQCLVRDVATHLTRATPRVMGVSGAEYPFSPDSRRVTVVPVYPGRGAFAPSLTHNARALLYLATDFASDVWHFVFAANPRTSSVLRALTWARKTKTVQTIASPPRDFSRARELLFGDRVVAQSEWTRRQLAEHLPEAKLDVILPSAPVLQEPSEARTSALGERLAIPRAAPVVVYPGDLEFSRGSQYFAELVEAIGPARRDTVFVYACRAKTAAAANVARMLEQRLSSHNVRFAGELESLPDLLALATLVVFPTDSAFGKVDVPIALLEAMRLRVPVLSFDFGPLAELGGTVQVPLGNAGALVEAARSLLDSDAERAQVARAQTTFLAELDPRRAADAYQQIYRDVSNLD